MMIVRHPSARPNSVHEEVRTIIKRNKEKIENIIDYCLENIQIDPEALTQTTLRYCDETLYWCELAHTDSQISYTFLYYAHLLRYYV